MNYIDIILLIFLVIAFILGFKDGFVRKIIGTLGFFLAIFLAILFYDYIGLLLNSILQIEIQFANIIGGFLIFIFIIILTSILKRIVHPFDRVNNLINQFTGGIIGVIQILFFLSALLYVLNIFTFPSEKDKNKSLIYSKIYIILPKSITFIEKQTPSTKNKIENYLIDDKK